MNAINSPPSPSDDGGVGDTQETPVPSTTQTHRKNKEGAHVHGDVLLRFLPMRLGKPDFAIAMDPYEPTQDTWQRCRAFETTRENEGKGQTGYTGPSQASAEETTMPNVPDTQEHDTTNSKLFRKNPMHLPPLRLPQQFGNAHVGTTFHAYVCLVNGGQGYATEIDVQAEMRCEGKKTVLFHAGNESKEGQDLDATGKPMQNEERGGDPSRADQNQPVERNLDTLKQLGPGERFDFCVQYPMQTAGPHSLVCSCTYTDAQGARRVLPQHFKFEVEYPLRITTSVKDVWEKGSQADASAGPVTFVEAALENLTDTPLLLRHVRFEPRPHLCCRLVGVDDEAYSSGICSSFLEHVRKAGGNGSGEDKSKPSAHSFAKVDSPLERERNSVVSRTLSAAKARAMDRISRVARNLDLMAPAGGTRHFVFALEEKRGKAPRTMGDVPDAERLGRLRVEWRMPMGEKGELRTQQVMASQSASANVELAVHFVPSPAALEAPFCATFKLRNLTEGTLGPVMMQIEATGPRASFLVQGKREVVFDSLGPLEEQAVDFTMVACKSGVHPLPAVCAMDKGTGTVLCSLPRYDMYVDGTLPVI